MIRDERFVIDDFKSRFDNHESRHDFHSNPDLLSSFLSDAAHVPGGYAAGVAFPRSAADVAAVVREARHVLPIGAQSSLTGGATPRGDVVLSTRALGAIDILSGQRVRVGVGVPLAELQRVLLAKGVLPPVPTFDGAFVGAPSPQRCGRCDVQVRQHPRW